MFEIGQQVISKRVGSAPEISGRVVRMYESGRREKLAVLQDAQGLSWCRELHELRLPEESK